MQLRGRSLRRLTPFAAAVILSAASLGITPSPSVACTIGVQPFTTAPDVQFLFVATVVAVSPDAIRLETDRVFEGSVPASLTFEPVPGDTCDAGSALDEGQTYVIGTEELTGQLTLAELWFQIDQGLVLPGSWTGAPTDAEELYALLSGMPDVAMAPQRSDALVAFGLALLLGALWSTSLRRRHVRVTR